VHLRLKDSARTRGSSVNWGWWVDLDSTCGPCSGPMTATLIGRSWIRNSSTRNDRIGETR
jgi:hypothetical protein